MEYEAYCEKLLDTLVTQGSDAYKENVRIAGVIEDKAQKTAALAGVFLAAGLAFIKKENLEPGSVIGGIDTLLFLAVAILLLVLTVLRCLQVIWVRDQQAPISLETMIGLATDTFNQPKDNIAFPAQQSNRWYLIHVWHDITRKQAENNQRKAKRLLSAQILLAGAIIATSSALFLIMVKALAFRIVQFLQS